MREGVFLDLYASMISVVVRILSLAAVVCTPSHFSPESTVRSVFGGASPGQRHGHGMLPPWRLAPVLSLLIRFAVVSHAGMGSRFPLSRHHG